MIISNGESFTIRKGLVFRDIIVETGGKLTILDRGLAIDTVLNGGVDFLSRAKTEHTLVENGGKETVQYEGVAIDTVVAATGTEQVNEGGITRGTKLLSGAQEHVLYGGAAAATEIDAGASETVDFRGQTASTTVHSGGALAVYGDAYSSFDDGGQITVYAGGRTFSTILTDGGRITVYSGGESSRDLVESAGLITLSGGTSVGLLLRDGGLEEITAGGSSRFTVVGSGGHEYVADGVAYRTTISAGGSSVIKTDGVAQDTRIEGGVLEMLLNAKIEGTLSFAAPNGRFVIDSANSPTAVISGFVAGDKIDFLQLEYQPSDMVAVTAPGIVTVSADSAVYTLNIAGAEVGSTDFRLASGGSYYGVELTTTVTAASTTPLTGADAMRLLPDLQAGLHRIGGNISAPHGFPATATEMVPGPDFSFGPSEVMPGIAGMLASLGLAGRSARALLLPDEKSSAHGFAAVRLG